MRGRTFTGAALLFLSTAAGADEQPICATRPGKSTAPCTVPAGHFQIETGLADWSLQKGGGERDTSLAIGETVFKYGLTDRSDIEVDVTPWERSASSAHGIHQQASGFGDINVIYKHELTSADAAVQVAVMPVVKIPAAKHSLGNGKWEAGLLVPVLFNIGKSPLSINVTPELDWVADGDGGGHHVAMTQVASLGWAISNKVSVSGELWGQWDWDPAGTTRQATADGSIAYLLNENVQLDAGANFGLNRNTPDVEIYAGISKRF
jgi:hypothetical protein